MCNGPCFTNVCVLPLKMTPCLLAWALTSSHESARHFGLTARYLRHFALKRRCITMSQTLLLLAWPRLLVGRAAGDLHLKSPFPRNSGVNPLQEALGWQSSRRPSLKDTFSQTLWCKPTSGRSGNSIFRRPSLKVSFSRTLLCKPATRSAGLAAQPETFAQNHLFPDTLV